jgi:hypothetical protein
MRGPSRSCLVSILAEEEDILTAHHLRRRWLEDKTGNTHSQRSKEEGGLLGPERRHSQKSAQNKSLNKRLECPKKGKSGNEVMLCIKFAERKKNFQAIFSLRRFWSASFLAREHWSVPP